MRAIRVHAFGDPSVLRLEEVPEPVVAPGQVLVALKAIGVNPVETYIRRGIYGPKTFPYTPGTDGAGIVEAVGDGVQHVKPGDRVYICSSISGAYAEKALCTEASVFPLPQKITFEQGAAIGVPYATAHRALHRRAQAQAGETVLIHGATGGVGLAAVQLAKLAGLTVLGTGGTEEGRALAKREGADRMFDHTKSGYEQEILAATKDGGGVELILEMLANVNLSRDLSLLARDGRVIVIGSRGKVEIDPRETMKRDADIRGMTLMNAGPDEVAQIHAELAKGIAGDAIRPVIGKSFPLTQAGSAHEAVMSNGALGKIILLVNGSMPP